jgi:hypothetical protein
MFGLIALPCCAWSCFCFVASCRVGDKVAATGSVVREFLLLHASVVDVVEAYYHHVAATDKTKDIKVCWALDAAGEIDGHLTKWSQKHQGAKSS